METRRITVWTVGHSNRSSDDLCSLLRQARISQIVDVRRFPTSRRFPQFSKEALSASLSREGVAYEHAEDLGGHRRPRAKSPHTGMQSEAFQAYADHMATPMFRSALRRLVDLARERPTAVMCAEANWKHCHRGLLADHLVADGLRVRHLEAPGLCTDHTLRDTAHLQQGRLVYRGPVQLGLGDWLE